MASWSSWLTWGLFAKQVSVWTSMSDLGSRESADHSTAVYGVSSVCTIFLRSIVPNLLVRFQPPFQVVVGWLTLFFRFSVCVRTDLQPPTPTAVLPSTNLKLDEQSGRWVRSPSNAACEVVLRQHR
jgi:hypothetical protein